MFILKEQGKFLISINSNLASNTLDRILNEDLYQLNTTKPKLTDILYNNNGPTLINLQTEEAQFHSNGNFIRSEVIDLKSLQIKELHVCYDDFISIASSFLNGKGHGKYPTNLHFLNLSDEVLVTSNTRDYWKPVKLFMHTKDGKIHKDSGPAVFDGNQEYYFMHGVEKNQQRNSFKDKFNELYK